MCLLSTNITSAAAVGCIAYRGWLTNDAVSAAPPDPKRWLLHPSLPVDVRLLGGLGALLGSYALFRQVRQLSVMPARATCTLCKKCVRIKVIT